MKYALRPEFRSLSHLYPPLTRFTLPPADLALGAFTLHGDRDVKVSRLTFSGKGCLADRANEPSAVSFRDPDSSFRGLFIEPAGIGDRSPCVIYLHGGGFVLPSAPYHYRIAKECALAVGCRVLFVDYRLAPRYPFPAAACDAFAAYRAMLHDGNRLGVDPDRIAVAGDSAGGNLAAVTALAARDAGLPLPRCQMLLYPVIDRRMEYASMRSCPDTPMWNAKLNEKMWKWYLPEVPSGIPVCYASPIEAASLAGLPPAYLETAEFDCLHDEGKAYADALERAGVSVVYTDVNGAPHGYDMAYNSAYVRGLFEKRWAFLRQTLA